MRTLSLIGTALLVAAVGGGALADDWPQWNGPNRNGVSPEKGLLKEWPKGGPKLVWTFNKAGNGYSAPAVVGDHAYLMGCRGDDEFLIALDGKGQEAWSVKTPLTDIAASATSEVSGVTNSTVTCKNSSGTNVGNSPQGPSDPAQVSATGLKPGTYTCTIVIDP